MKARYRVKWTGEDGQPWAMDFTNKIKMIKYVMFLTRNEGNVYWLDLTGDYAWLCMPKSITMTKAWKERESV